MAKKISEVGVMPEAQQHSLSCVHLGLCANLFECYGSPDVPYRLKGLRECVEATSRQTRKKKNAFPEERSGPGKSMQITWPPILPGWGQREPGSLGRPCLGCLLFFL